MPPRHSADTEAPDATPRLIPFVTMAGAVVGVLALGAALRTRAEHGPVFAGPGRGASRPAPAAAPPVAGRPEPDPSPAPPEVLQAPAPEPEPPPPVLPVVGPTTEAALAERVEIDRGRLTAPGPAWTTRVALLCNHAGVRRMIGKYGPDSPLHVLPATVKGQSCFGLFWGRYGSEGDAQRAADRPPDPDLGPPATHPQQVREVVR